MAATKKYYLFSRKLKEEAEYNAEGRRDGLTRTYYRSGAVRRETVYQNGSKQGTEKTYTRNGSLHLAIDYQDGLRHGMYRAYKKGNLHREYTYRKGKKHGPAKWLFKDGTSFVFACENGREKIGRWKNYDEDGILIMEKVYTSTGDLLCELFYEYEELGRTVTLQWTRFLDDEIEKYRQKASEYDETGLPEFPVVERNKYPPAESSARFSLKRRKSIL